MMTATWTIGRRTCFPRTIRRRRLWRRRSWTGWCRMLVELGPDACHDVDAMHALLSLVRCFTSGRHEWVPTAEAAESLGRFFAEFHPRLAPVINELSRKSAVSL